MAAHFYFHRDDNRDYALAFRCGMENQVQMGEKPSLDGSPLLIVPLFDFWPVVWELGLICGRSLPLLGLSGLCVAGFELQGKSAAPAAMTFSVALDGCWPGGCWPSWGFSPDLRNTRFALACPLYAGVVSLVRLAAAVAAGTKPIPRPLPFSSRDVCLCW